MPHFAKIFKDEKYKNLGHKAEPSKAAKEARDKYTAKQDKAEAAYKKHYDSSARTKEQAAASRAKKAQTAKDKAAEAAKRTPTAVRKLSKDRARTGYIAVHGSKDLPKRLR